MSNNGVIHSKARKSLALIKHPPYLEMISDAIVTLKERNGSSQYAIGMFIQDKYEDLPANFKKRLLNQLKKLVASDKLVKVKASYKLPSTAKKALAKKKPAAKTKPPAPKAKPAAKTVTKKAQLAKKKPAANNSNKPAKTKEEELTAGLTTAVDEISKHNGKSFGIKGWPYTPKKSDSHSSDFRRSSEHNPPTHTEHAMYSSTRVETIQIDGLGQPKTTLKNSVKPLTIKATYKEDIVRFPFILSDGLTNLKKHIATRFPLKLESFRLKYEDKDGDLILIACDTNLDLSADDFRRPDGHTVIRLLVCLLVS